jgi:hypothetical protein
MERHGRGKWRTFPSAVEQGNETKTVWRARNIGLGPFQPSFALEVVMVPMDIT